MQDDDNQVGSSVARFVGERISEGSPSAARRRGPRANARRGEPWVPRVELPKGDGAISGVGETFEANAFTGSGSMSVPLVSSPSRGAPSLSLTYAHALLVDALAMACSRRARAPSASRDDPLEWARACIACYRRAAERRTLGYDRQASEVPPFGLRAVMILRWGAQPGHSILDPDHVSRWIQNGIGGLSSPAFLRSALGRPDGSDERERAVCLRERLQVGFPLFEKGLLPRALLPWFTAAGGAWRWLARYRQAGCNVHRFPPPRDRRPTQRP